MHFTPFLVTLPPAAAMWWSLAVHSQQQRLRFSHEAKFPRAGNCRRLFNLATLLEPTPDSRMPFFVFSFRVSHGGELRDRPWIDSASRADYTVPCVTTNQQERPGAQREVVWALDATQSLATPLLAARCPKMTSMLR